MNCMQSNAYSPPILKFSNHRKQTENNPQIDKPGSKSGFHNGFRLTWKNMKDYHNQPKSRENRLSIGLMLLALHIMADKPGKFKVVYTGFQVGTRFATLKENNCHHQTVQFMIAKI